MLILLPPSETKATRQRGTALRMDALSLPELNPARAQVIEALASVSAQPDAAKALGISPNLTPEIARNARLWVAPTLKAADLYTGVLYDALGLATMDAAARRRANRRAIIISALFGALRLNDRVPPYRLSMSVNLPGVGSLTAHWRSPLRRALASPASRGLIIDCRSSTYAAAWTPPSRWPQEQRWVQIDVPGATHMAKRTRGLVTRALCSSGEEPRTPVEVALLLERQFVTYISEPRTSRGPWVLSATSR